MTLLTANGLISQKLRNVSNSFFGEISKRLEQFGATFLIAQHSAQYEQSGQYNERILNKPHELNFL